MSVRARLVSRAAAGLVVLAALLVVAPAASSAERRPVLVVDATTDGTGGATVRALEARLAREDALGPVLAEVSEALRRPVTPAESWEGDARSSLGEARALLARFAYREAADRAHGALDRLAGVADRPGARKLLAELALVEGQGLVGAGDAAAAAVALRLVHRLDPGRVLDPARYLPEVVAAYLAAGRSLEATSELHLDAPGADELLVDGVLVGGERHVVAVTPGPHLVTARGEAILNAGRRIDVPDRRAMRVDLAPEVAPLPVRVTRVVQRLRGASGDDAILDATRTLTRIADARDAVLVVVADGALATRIYTDRGGLAPPRPVEAADAILAPLRPLVMAPPVLPPPPPPPPEPWYRQRWGKTTIGVGVGVVLAGIVTAMIVRDPGTSTISGPPVVD